MRKHLAKLFLTSIIIFLIFAFPAYLVGKWKGVLMLLISSIASWIVIGMLPIILYIGACITGEDK